MKILNIINKIGEPYRSFNGRDITLTDIKMEVPKCDSMIEYYDWENGNIITFDQWKLDLKTNPYMSNRWRFLWKNSPIKIDEFAMHTKTVIDAPDTDVYLVNFMLTDDINLTEYTNVLTNKYNWEELCLPWKTFNTVTYT